MKPLMALVLFVMSVTAHAGCRVSFEEPYGIGMGDGFIGKKTYAKIVRILEAKGYEVIADRAGRNTADYELEIGTYLGYDCGTGLTWVDYLVVPAGFSVNLSVNRGNMVFHRSGDSVFPVAAGGVKVLIRRKLFQAIRAIPKCEG